VGTTESALILNVCAKVCCLDPCPFVSFSHRARALLFLGILIPYCCSRFSLGFRNEFLLANIRPCSIQLADTTHLCLPVWIKSKAIHGVFSMHSPESPIYLFFKLGSTETVAIIHFYPAEILNKVIQSSSSSFVSMSSQALSYPGIREFKGPWRNLYHELKDSFI
jgi:hypothetical protein